VSVRVDGCHRADGTAPEAPGVKIPGLKLQGTNRRGANISGLRSMMQPGTPNRDFKSAAYTADTAMLICRSPL